MTQTAPVILVTGASRGIGRAISLRCAYTRAQLVLTARDAASLQKVAIECVALGAPTPHCVALDFASSEGIPELFLDVSKRFGRLDGLVNNAGVLHEGLLGMIRPDDIDHVLAVNIKAPLTTMQYAARLMTRRQAGSIVNLVSIMGVKGAAGLSLYAASKAALLGATLSAAKELAPRGIRVNAVAPGFIDTDMTRDLPEPARAIRIGSIGLRRAGSPEEVANVVVFLLGPESTYVSGQVVGVDGQMTV